jgi:predicted dehydrogenase
MESDDAAGLLLRFDGGARGVCTISQVSAGRRNRLAWEIDGDSSALAWASDDPDHLWIGHRGQPNEVVEKDPAMLSTAGLAATAFPGGHVEGYPDTFRAMLSAVYADIAAGRPATQPSYPTFADGHDIVAVCEAVASSARQRTWTPVDAGLPS